MKFLLTLSVLFLVSCKNEPNVDYKFNLASDLIKKDKVNEADSIFHSIEYTKEIDFNYKLLDIIIKFRYSKFAISIIASQTFIKKYPNNPLGYYYAGLCDFNLSNYSNAEIYFTQSLNNFSKTSSNGFIYLEKKTNSSNFDEASIYNDLIFMMGLSKRFVGKYKSSITYLESCLSNQYRSADAYLIIGDCYSNLWDKINARQYYLLAQQHGNKDAGQYLKIPLKERPLDRLK